eukprot:CAMPEP_0170577494 /NCGR_PEP_ID=MMETSP0224-20130122/4957_1 /TAXON_ID=285029 /ORGANISM="Togula jolla, Strain CCCM 725" /LENGTH=641 /DNA_ID=CAMNT_0010900409 /DNA_START=170 /DNA_END=2095 /DNA_ORIENTATION=-
MSWSTVLEDSRFDTLMGIIVLLNLVTMILETNENAKCENCRRTYLEVIDWIFLGIYTIELLCRFYAEHGGFCRNRWNMLMVFIVVVGYANVIATGLERGVGALFQFVRFLRILRLSRALRLLNGFPQLSTMVQGFINATAAMLWGIIMILVLFCILLAIVTVELVHPIQRDRIPDINPKCEVAFGSVEWCVIWFFQTLVAGDSWGTCTLPVIQEELWTFFLFAVALVFVTLGSTNLILAVIVEQAAKAHEKDLETSAKRRQKSQAKAAARLYEIFESIDADCSGTISYDELIQGYEDSLELRHNLQLLNLDKKDIKQFFDLLDLEGDGELSYQELTDHMQTASTKDVRTQIMVVRLQADQISHMVSNLSLARKRCANCGCHRAFSSEMHGRGSAESMASRRSAEFKESCRSFGNMISFADSVRTGYESEPPPPARGDDRPASLDGSIELEIPRLETRAEEGLDDILGMSLQKGLLELDGDLKQHLEKLGESAARTAREIKAIRRTLLKSAMDHQGLSKGEPGDSTSKGEPGDSPEVVEVDSFAEHQGKGSSNASGQSVRALRSARTKRPARLQRALSALDEDLLSLRLAALRDSVEQTFRDAGTMRLTMNNVLSDQRGSCSTSVLRDDDGNYSEGLASFDI